jgi:hypothetical protein
VTADSYLFVPASAFDDRGLRVLLVIAATVCAVLIGCGVALGMIKELVFLTTAVVGAILVWRLPQLATIFLIAFTPVNRFVIFVGFKFVSNVTLLNGVQLWKDAIVAVLLVRVIHEALVRREAPRLYMMDLLVVMFVTLNLAYVVYPGTLEDSSLVGRFLGFRLDAYFLFAYFIGRGLTLKRHHVRWIMISIIPGSVMVALVAGWQWVFPGMANNIWNMLGYQAFVDAVNGSSEVAVRTRDLAGLSIPRSSSLLMSDLALAFYQLMLIPIAAGLLLVVQRKTSALGHLAALVFLLLMLATLAWSGTRSAILVIPVSLLLLIVVTKSWGKGLAAGVAAIPLVVAALLVLGQGSTGDWFESLFSTQEGSTNAHTEALERGVRVIRDEPLGQGLGTSHTVGYQLGVRESFATESWYLQLGTETGILGIFLYSLVILGATVAPLLASLKVRDPWLKALALGAGGGGMGFLLVGLVLHVWEAPVIAAVFWLFVGIATRAPQLEEQWIREEAAVEAQT